MSGSKNVLQQSNTNVPSAIEARTDLDKAHRKRRLSHETENVASDASVTTKLRKVRLESVSSHRLSYCSDDGGSDYDDDDDEGGEEEESGEGEEEEEEVVRRVKKAATPRPIIPNYVSKGDKAAHRKRRKSRQESASSQREAKPQASVSIAKRNARERNRVKLVNQGFATLRSRIPDYISEIYTEENKKKNAKKVSKVETLRMALGYIRHLTEMLELRTADAGDWFRIKTETSSTGYPSPVDTDYQQSPAYASRDCAFYDYDLSGKEEPDDDGLLLDDYMDEARADKASLIMSESAFSVDVGCCYDLDKVDAHKSTSTTSSSSSASSPLPSMTETFPKKNLRAYYDALATPAPFHV